MPPNWKDRAGRLQAFARLSSDSGAAYNAVATRSQPGPEKRSETTPGLPVRDPVRQEMADAARLPATPLAHPNGPAADRAPVPAPSPPLQTPAAAAATGGIDRPEFRREDLFDGSQLGESFMNSAPSTPRNEPQELDADLSTPHALSGNAAPNGRHFAGDSGPGRLRTARDAAFVVGEDLKMSVVTGASRTALPHLMDGFEEETFSYHTTNQFTRERTGPAHPSRLAEHHPTLPMRDGRPRRPPGLRIKRLEDHGSHPILEDVHWPRRRGKDSPRQAVILPESEDEASSPTDGERPPLVPAEANRAKTSTRRQGTDKRSSVIRAAPERPAKTKRRRQNSIDYDDEILSTMTFNDLHDEPFDLDPARASGKKAQDSSTELPLRLEKYRDGGEEEQHQLFASMSIDDWEASGDWFVEQFADLMKKLRLSRRDRRRTMREFEEEAARREEALRMRSDAIDRKLAKMKQDGQRVVEDQGLL